MLRYIDTLSVRTSFGESMLFGHQSKATEEAQVGEAFVACWQVKQVLKFGTANLFTWLVLSENGLKAPFWMAPVIRNTYFSMSEVYKGYISWASSTTMR